MGNRTAANGTGTFKNVMDYVDQLHEDIGKMALLLEQLLEEQGFMAVLGSRGSWGLTNAYNQPARWRLPYLYRLYIPSDVDRTTRSLFYLVQLETDAVFDFPTIVCGRITHLSLEAGDVRGEIANDLATNALSLTYDAPQWQRIREENGWTIAEAPAFDTSIETVQGYILNLFDMTDRRRVIDNISRPLANPDKNLDEMLTVGKYAFGGGREP